MILNRRLCQAFADNFSTWLLQLKSRVAPLVHGCIARHLDTAIKPLLNWIERVELVVTVKENKDLMEYAKAFSCAARASVPVCTRTRLDAFL
jgi:hypothetical protein